MEKALDLLKGELELIKTREGLVNELDANTREVNYSFLECREVFFLLPIIKCFFFFFSLKIIKEMPKNRLSV